MLIFGGVAALLVLITLIVLLRPLLSRQAEIADSGNQTVTIYREQFAELEQDRVSDVLNTAQYQEAKHELEQRLLDEAQLIVPIEHEVKLAKPDRLLAIILLLIVPVSSILIYLTTGNPHAISALKVAPVSQQFNGQDVPANIEQILQSLRQQLKQDPSDGAGWALLARADAKLQRYDEAVEAFEHAIRIIPDDPQLLVDYAITLAFINQHNMTGKPEALVNRALELDPEQVKALMLSASAAFERQDYPRAITLWERLLQKLPADSEAAVSVSTALEEARRLDSGAR
ncbi:c-type cytochrome biogenesis protein CcmI [Methylobacillus gramineus]|uniref:c-type cytochrome biogenesis protein CcmI n=1 Tax=Methylobacillus gramineus TaxID=755169 RepID=UPI001CFFF620|nr:c-type cytochrome biogenesis protein CcmI [Methylobacillus gramineus]MCB5183625.1 c-type cytochrome biogenesis protein CcmI [Methylobacillus gramineus]